MKHLIISLLGQLVLCNVLLSHVEAEPILLTPEDRNVLHRLDRLIWVDSLSSENHAFVSVCLLGDSKTAYPFTPGQMYAFDRALKVAVVHSMTDTIAKLKTWDENESFSRSFLIDVVTAFETEEPFEFLLAYAGPPPDPNSSHPWEAPPVTEVVVAAEARARRKGSTLNLDFSALPLSPYHSLLLDTSTLSTEAAIQTLLDALAGVPTYDPGDDPHSLAATQVLGTYLASSIEPILQRLEDPNPAIPVTSAEVEYLVGVLRFVRDDLATSQRDRAVAVINAFPTPSPHLQGLISKLPELLE